MTTSQYMIAILLSVIILVFILDYVKNNKKGETNSKGFNPLKWLLKRKKNIIISALLIIAIKIPIHYFLNHDTCETKWLDDDWGTLMEKTFCVEFKDFFSAVFTDHTYVDLEYEEPFYESVDFIGVLDSRIELFIPITIIYLIIVWFFNDKIKAQ